MTEIREWINTVIAFAGLIVLIYGIFAGVDKLEEINVNLKDIKADTVTTNEFSITNPNSDTVGKITHNGSGICIGDVC